MLCNSCDAVFINRVFCHETGCSKTGAKPKTEKRRHYVGIKVGSRERVYFASRLIPSRHYFPEYVAVIGPFKTKRAAVWASLHPMGYVHVDEAETLSRGAL